jgi:hypothetical protein
MEKYSTEQTLLLVDNLRNDYHEKLANNKAVLKHFVDQGLFIGKQAMVITTNSKSYPSVAHVIGDKNPLNYYEMMPKALANAGIVAADAGMLFYCPGVLSFSRGQTLYTQICDNVSGCIRTELLSTQQLHESSKHDYYEAGAALMARWLNQWAFEAQQHTNAA